MFGKRELHLYFPYRLGSLAQLICIEMRPMGSATRRLSKVSSPTATLNHHVQQLVSHYYFPSGAAVLEEGGGQQKKTVREGGREQSRHSSGNTAQLGPGRPVDLGPARPMTYSMEYIKSLITLIILLIYSIE